MKKQYSITVHCIVKNEENFIRYAVRSVVDFVDVILIFDTGSEDDTIKIIMELQSQYPDKIIFEEKGLCDKKRHTELRQEMVDRTTTEWFLILDGDEVWTKRGMDELHETLNFQSGIECIVAPFYLCVGDVYHQYYKKGNFRLLGKEDFFSPRIIKKIKGVHWDGNYNDDTLVYVTGEAVVQNDTTIFLSEKYWHLTHLVRSSKDKNDYSSGGVRHEKRRLTYSLIGKRITESIPEVFVGTKVAEPLPRIKSILNFIYLAIKKII